MKEFQFIQTMKPVAMKASFIHSIGWNEFQSLIHSIECVEFHSNEAAHLAGCSSSRSDLKYFDPPKNGAVIYMTRWGMEVRYGEVRSFSTGHVYDFYITQVRSALRTSTGHVYTWPTLTSRLHATNPKRHLRIMESMRHGKITNWIRHLEITNSMSFLHITNPISHLCITKSMCRLNITN